MLRTSLFFATASLTACLVPDSPEANVAPHETPTVDAVIADDEHNLPASCESACLAPGWRMTILDQDVGDHVDARIAADAGGELHIAYTAHRGAVRYIHLPLAELDPEITRETLETDDGAGQTWSPAIALAGSRAPGGESVVPFSWVAPPQDALPDVSVAWSRRNTGVMRLARRVANGDFTTQTIATGVNTSRYATDLELDADGHAHVTWIEGSDADDDRRGPLQHTRETDEGFVTEQAASSAFDRGSAIAFDGAGDVQVAFYDLHGFLATKHEGGWSTSDPANALDGGLDPSLAAGPTGLHLLSGPGATYGHRAADGAWTFETVEGAGFTGLLSSLVLDVDEAPHAIWLTEGGLRYATRDADGAWHLEDVIGGLEPWTTPDVVLDVDGAPAIVTSAIVDSVVSLVLLQRD